MLFAALKDKKSSHDDMKENLRFKQSWLDLHNPSGISLLKVNNRITVETLEQGVR